MTNDWEIFSLGEYGIFLYEIYIFPFPINYRTYIVHMGIFFCMGIFFLNVNGRKSDGDMNMLKFGIFVEWLVSSPSLNMNVTKSRD
jgi:hypothetical protein